MLASVPVAWQERSSSIRSIDAEKRYEGGVALDMTYSLL